MSDFLSDFLSEGGRVVGDTTPVLVEAMMAEGDGNIALRLVAVNGAELPAFHAGAHIDVHLPGGSIRQYSIASAPEQRDHYLICVKREAQSRGGSASVHDKVRVGDRLTISAPRNLFALQQGAHHVLIAGGIGITPLLSMAEALAAQNISFELHYYTGSRRNIAFRRRLAAGFGCGTVHIHISEEGDSARAASPDALLKPVADGQIYMCGPLGFMSTMRDRALAAGWEAGRVHQEAFAAAPAAAPGEGGDGDSFDVQLQSDGRIFCVEAGRSIASVLVEAGVAVPLSCEMGICGACLTPVVSGEIDHRDEVTGGVGNEIALCCSRAKSPLLVIDL